MQKIERYKLLSKMDKIKISVSNFLKRSVVALTVGSVGGIVTGKLAQDYERSKTGYDPIAHQKLADEVNNKKVEPATDFEKWKNQETEKKKNGILEWFKKKKEEIKMGVTNPKEYIKSTDMYKELLLKYQNGLKVIDDAAFVLPALLMFIMLSSYISRKMKDSQEDDIKKKENEMLSSRLNQLIDTVNDIMVKLEGNPQDAELNASARKILLDSKDLIESGADF